MSPLTRLMVLGHPVSMVPKPLGSLSLFRSSACVAALDDGGKTQDGELRHVCDMVVQGSGCSPGRLVIEATYPPQLTTIDNLEELLPTRSAMA